MFKHLVLLFKLVQLKLLGKFVGRKKWAKNEHRPQFNYIEKLSEKKKILHRCCCSLNASEHWNATIDSLRSLGN